MTDPAIAASPPANNFASVALSEPIMRGETKITDLTMRKPKAGELRGLALQDLLSSDVGAIITLIPRITDPILTRDEAENLPAEDLAEMGGVIRGFFMTTAERKAIENYIADMLPKT